jgi:uncharacterized protein
MILFKKPIPFFENRFSNGWAFFQAEVVLLFVGVLIGVLFFSAIAILCLGLGAFSISGIHGIQSGFWNDIFSLLKPAISEEIWVRGFIFGLIYSKFNFPSALVISSSIFGALHFFNPDFNIFAFLGIVSAGLLFASLLAFYNSFALVIGIHWAWNFAQGVIWGLPISGLQKFSSNSLLQTHLNVDSIVSGGKFGLEASFLTVSIIFVIAMYFAKKVYSRNKTTGQKSTLFLEGWNKK